MPQYFNKLYTTIHLISLLFIFPYSSQDNQELKESELIEIFSPGAYFQEQDVDLYDRVFPIIFKFKKPEWSDQLKLKLSSECSDDKWGDGNGTQSLCPVFFHLHQVLLKQVESTSALPTSSLPEADETVIFECNILSRHFMSDKLTNEKFNLYFAYLKKCSDNKYVESDLITEYSGKIQAVYDTMSKKFMDEYYNKLPTEDRENQASELNDKVALSGLLTSHYLSLVKRWRRGFRDCKAGFVPDSLVSERRFRQLLGNLEKKINSSTGAGDANYTFTMPYEGADITRYYKALIADCVYAGDKFYVRVLVPVTKVRKSPTKLIKIRAIPFYIVEDGKPSICMLEGFFKGRLFHSGVEVLGKADTVTSVSTEVTCDSTNFHMCKIPDHYESFSNTVVDCARALMLYDNDPSNERQNAIVTQCPMDCIDLRFEQLPIGIRAHDELSTIYMIPDPNKQPAGINLECRQPPLNVTNEEGAEEEPETYTVMIPAVKKGVVGVVLSCDCILPLPQQNILASSDCSKDLLVLKVQAFHYIGPDADSTDQEGAGTGQVGDDEYVDDGDVA